MEQTATASPLPPILRLPNEVLDIIFAFLFCPLPEYKLLISWDDPPPSQSTLNCVVAVAATCRRFHPTAGAHLYRKVWFALPHHPRRIPRLFRTFTEHPEALALCKLAYYGDLTLPEDRSNEPVEPFAEAERMLTKLKRLVNGRGMFVTAREWMGLEVERWDVDSGRRGSGALGVGW